MVERAWPEDVRRFLTPDGGAAGLMGMRVASFGPGTARLALVVRRDMTNPFGMCHGGVIFALADTAMGFASNSRGGAGAVTQHCSISYLVPARVGDALEAEARETARSGKNAIYDVSVTNQRGETVAVLRGTAFERAGTEAFKGVQND